MNKDDIFECIAMLKTVRGKEPGSTGTPHLFGAQTRLKTVSKFT